MGQILAAFTALVDLVKMMSALSAWIKKTFGDDPAQFIREAGETFADVHKAQTVEEKQAAARKIQDLIGKIK